MVGGKGGWEHVHNEETYRKRELLYGSLTAPCHTPEAIKKRKETCIKKYGSVCGHMKTDEIKAKIISRYGSLTRQMNTPEARAKSQETRIKRYGSVMGACKTPEIIKRHIETYGSLMGQCLTAEALEKRKNTFLSKYGATNGKANSKEAIEKGRETKYQKHIKKTPSLKNLVYLKKGDKVIWQGEQYFLLVYLYGFERAIKCKSIFPDKLDTNKTWKKGTKWYGYTIHSKL